MNYIERGKGIGAIYTTEEYCNILYKYLIVNTSDIQNKKFFDPACGTGNLFIKLTEDYNIDNDNIYETFKKYKDIELKEIYSNMTKELLDIHSEINRLTMEEYKKLGYTKDMDKYTFLEKLYDKYTNTNESYDSLYNSLNW